MTTQHTDTAAATDAAVAYLREHDAEHLAQLDEFLRIESVSADPERADEVRRTAQWIADELTRIGVERATVHETTHHPIVTAEWMRAGDDAPTILVYCHYDVQPADPLDEWIRPPFEPRHEDERVYARGAGDDKGQLFMHLKAVEAWMRTAGRLPVNLRFFFEGDEEVGSEPIEQFIDEHADLLEADVCVVSDGDTFDDDGTPAIGYGLRGIAYWEVRVHGPRQDVHSGQYGGGVDNPANVLVRMLASLTDEHGRITIPGFYDAVRDLTDEEHAAYSALPFDEAAWRDETGVPAADRWRARALAARAPLGAPDVRHQRHLGRLHRARARRRSSRPGRPRRSARGSCPTRTTARSSSRCRRTSRRSRPRPCAWR